MFLVFSGSVVAIDPGAKRLRRRGSGDAGAAVIGRDLEVLFTKSGVGLDRTCDYVRGQSEA